jgi:prepilin-type N-terminal cleavage/methylation domain-containing protein
VNTQKGMTMVELVVATAVAGIIVVSLGTAIYQILTVSGYGNNRLIAAHELENAAYWFNRDGQQAVSASGGAGLSLTLSDNSTVNYSLSSAELRRTAGGNAIILLGQQPHRHHVAGIVTGRAGQRQRERDLPCLPPADRGRLMKNEKGQALPMAILALAIGALVIVPFLSHASSSLTGTSVYGQTIAEQNAADAGIEHAIWSLTYGSLAEQFTEPGDEVTYQLPETLNGCATTVTVTANATSRGGVSGEIADAVIDTLEFDNSNCYLPSLVSVAENVCAIAYRGLHNDGYLKTVSIDANSNIGNSAIDTLTFDTSSCYEPKIVYVSGNIYAIAYRGPGNRGYLKTVSIDANGNIGNSVINSLTFDSTDGYEPDIIQVNGSVYAIAYRGWSDQGHLITATIAANGDIGNSIVDSLTFDTSSCYEPDITRVSGNIFAIAYRGSSTRGDVVTASIAANGDIGYHVIDSITLDTSRCYEPDITPVAGNIYAIAFRDSSNRGYLKTISINASGIIGNSVIDTLAFDSTRGYEPSIIPVAGYIFAIAYRGPNNDGYLKTLTIAADGSIGSPVIDTLKFEGSEGYEPVIVHVADDIFAIAYRGPGDAGFICTVGISTQGATAASWKIVAMAGQTTILAMVNTDNTTADIVSWQIQ